MSTLSGDRDGKAQNSAARTSSPVERRFVFLIPLCGQLQGFPYSKNRRTRRCTQLQPHGKAKKPPDAPRADLRRRRETRCSSSAAPAPPAPAPTPVVDVRAANVSGRPWKQPPKSRSSSLKMTQPRKSWDAKKRDREARQRAREKEAELVEARKERIAEQKRKTEEKRSRKRRNEFRNAQYQVITNDKTVKSLSKKKLRQIKRTRVAADGEVELVDAYAPMHGPRAKRVRGKK